MSKPLLGFSVENISGVIFDLDQTIVDSSSAATSRKARDWRKVYGLIRGFKLYEEIDHLMESLRERGLKVAIVTTSPESYCSKVLQHFSIKPDVMVCWHDTTRRKPHPDPMELALARLGLPASQVITVGDMPGDIQSAHAAGLPAIAVTWGGTSEADLLAENPEFIFRTPNELCRLLLGT